MLRIVVCVSGGGTNLQALIDSIESGQVTDTEIVRVISNNKNAYALERAKCAGIDAMCISPKDYATRDDFHVALTETLKNAGVDIVTIGQYIQPSKLHLEVAKYYTPEEFDELDKLAEKIGFEHRQIGPLVRSSYRAAELV